jgi:hypothetical protein
VQGWEKRLGLRAECSGELNAQRDDLSLYLSSLSLSCLESFERPSREEEKENDKEERERFQAVG